MTPDPLLIMLYGALATATATSGLFFLRFWREADDRLFLLFALAFLVLTPNWIVLAFDPDGEMTSVAPYLFRLFAFLLIVYGIVDKNLRPPAA